MRMQPKPILFRADRADVDDYHVVDIASGKTVARMASLYCAERRATRLNGHARPATVTTDGMVPRQPGMSVSLAYGSDIQGARLNVSRHYRTPSGRYVIHSADCDGMMFGGQEQAWRYALDRGYIREHFTHPSVRAHRTRLELSAQQRRLQAAARPSAECRHRQDPEDPTFFHYIR